MKGVQSVMGGKILEYEAKTIRDTAWTAGEHKGRIDGRDSAMIESIRNLMDSLNYTAQQAMEALKVPTAEQKKYASQL